MIAQKNVSYMYYTNDALVTTALPTVANTIGIRRKGEALCDASALVAGDEFQVIAMDSNGKIRESPMFAWSNLISKNITSLSAQVSQVSSIGYNGSDGDIVATNNGNYLVTLGLRDTLKQVGGKRLYKFGEYASGVTAKNYDVAINLAGGLLTNFSKEAFIRVVPKAICSFAVTVADQMDHAATVVKGSKYITVATNSQYSSTEELAVGDYVRLGSVGGGTALTSPVYRVVELTSTTVFKVDRPVTNASGTYAVATTDLEVVRKANAEAATTKWGLVLTGNDADAPISVGLFGPNSISFSVGVSSDFGTTEVRLTTAPFMGEATYKQVNQMYWELYNNNREKYRIAEYNLAAIPSIPSSDTIDHLRTFHFKDTTTNALGYVAEGYYSLIIASDSDANANLDTVFSQS